jgi:CspA family cold shock protein
MSKAATTTGRVKFWNDYKGWGFLICADGKSEAFVHWSNLQDQTRGNEARLVEDDQVEFEVRDGTKGLEAFRVVVIRESPYRGSQCYRKETTK